MSLPQTPRRSRRFQPLATPSAKQGVPPGVDCTWDGEPIYTRPCNTELDFMQEDIEERELEQRKNGEGEGQAEEAVFYASFTMKKQRPTQYRGRGSAAAADDSKVYRPGDTILVETGVLYRQKRPPSVAVIVAMWEVRKAGEEFCGNPERMRLRVHWFLRPTELAAIREKREHAENEIYYSLALTDILVPSVILSHCSVSTQESHILKKKVAASSRSKGQREAVETEAGDGKFYCRYAINSQRGLYYSWNWDEHYTEAIKTAFKVPDDDSETQSTWGQGLEWNVDTTEDKRRRTKGGQPPRKRVKLERNQRQHSPSGSEGDSGSEAEIKSDAESDDDVLEDIAEEDESVADEDDGDDDDGLAEPKTPSRRKRKRGDGSAPKTPRRARKTLAQPTPHSKAVLRKRQKRKGSGSRKKGGFVVRAPTLDFKTDMGHLPKDPWLRAMHVLHVGNRPDALPCRGTEYEKVLQCVGDLLEEGSGGCVYISGVPGTGKTATVHTVVRELKRMAEANEISPFTYVEINGLRIPEPSVAYTLLWEAIVRNADPTHEANLRVSSKESLKALTHHFNGRSRGPAAHAYVVLMDELDQLVTAKQDVIYNFFNWPTLANSNLVVIAVANTMDLPERVMTGRVRSRLGMTRINFQPYTTNQLQEIVRARLNSAKQGLDAEQAAQEVLSEDAVKLAAVRIARITGDARRVLDVCRRVVENVNVKKIVGGPSHVLKVLSVMQNSPTAGYLADCSLHERIMLASLIRCIKREGVEEIKWSDLQYQHLNYLGVLAGINDSARKPTTTELITVLDSLVASRAVLLEDGASVARKAEGERRLLLNVEQIEVERVLSDVGGTTWKNVLSA